MRLSRLVHAALLCAWASIPLETGQGQTRSRGGGGPDKPDTIPSTRVILVPAVERYNASRIGGGIKDLKVLAVYTTDGQVARTLAGKIHANIGSSLIPLERAGKSAEEFARMMVDSVVEKTARRNMNRAIIVVAEPDLLRPFLHGAVGERGAKAFDEEGGIATFIVFVRADNLRLLTMRPF